MRSALDVVKLYIHEVWNKGRTELLPELCAERVIRHDANTVTVLELDEQIARIRHNFEDLRPTFEPIIFTGDHEIITLVWNVTGRDPNWKWCGIEIFRVQHGKIVEVWNSPYVDGRWSQEGALYASIAGRNMLPLPLMGLDWTAEGAKIQIPLDAHGIATWLALAFGLPTSTASGDGWWEHRFAPGGVQEGLALSYAEGDKPARTLQGAEIEKLDIRWARSGLMNADVTLKGSVAESEHVLVPQASRTTRLAECFGHLALPGGMAARIVSAAIIIEGKALAFSGEVTLRHPASVPIAGLCGTGELQFGWRHAGSELRFSGTAEIYSPEGAFEDCGETEAVFHWKAPCMTAVLHNASAEVT